MSTFLLRITDAFSFRMKAYVANLCYSGSEVLTATGMNDTISGIYRRVVRIIMDVSEEIISIFWVENQQSQKQRNSDEQMIRSSEMSFYMWITRLYFSVDDNIVALIVWFNTYCIYFGKL
jgi:hypothetical protein